MDLDELNRHFSIPGQLRFKAGPGGIVLVAITNRHASATVSLLGGQVIEYQPVGEEPVLWLSPSSHFEPGRAIRGGIPICWPWFGAHPDPTNPAHGFVRTLVWDVREAGADNSATSIRLGVRDNPSTRALWPHAFDLEVTVTIGPWLSVELVGHNTGKETVDVTAALHSYLSVGGISEVTIHGVEGCTYLDKVEAFRPKVQDGAVVITGEIDRIYLHTSTDCLVEDRVYRRVIRVAKQGSRSTVVWNPGADKAARMSDMGDQDYRKMVCVEAANTLDDQVVLPPGAEHRLRTIISTAPLG